MTGWPILSTITFLPLLGVVLMLFISDDNEAGRKNIRWITLFTTIATFLVSLLIWTVKVLLISPFKNVSGPLVAT